MSEDKKTSLVYDCVTSDGMNESYFSTQRYDLTGTNQRMLSEQNSAVNFRLRTSDASYASGWHVANDPTLLIVLSGCIELELRNGDTKRFGKGEMFIAKDFLSKGVDFDDEKHGHKARVLGEDELQVLHLKLSKLLQ